MMSRIRSLEPSPLYFTTTVAVPITKPISLNITGLTIKKLEENFIKLRDNASSYYEKCGYNRCRATLKWAASCNGSLKEIANSTDLDWTIIQFTFSFSTLTELIEFTNNLKEHVRSSVM